MALVRLEGVRVPSDQKQSLFNPPNIGPLQWRPPVPGPSPSLPSFAHDTSNPPVVPRDREDPGPSMKELSPFKRGSLEKLLPEGGRRKEQPLYPMRILDRRRSPPGPLEQRRFVPRVPFLSTNPRSVLRPNPHKNPGPGVAPVRWPMAKTVRERPLIAGRRRGHRPPLEPNP